VPSGKTGLGQSSLTGSASELAQNSTPKRLQVGGRYGPSVQRSHGSRSYFLRSRFPAVEAVVASDATIRADLQGAQEVSFHNGSRCSAEITTND
jgi:hypothetical protein